MSEQSPQTNPIDPNNPPVSFLSYAEKEERQKITDYLKDYKPDYEVRPGEEGRITDPHLAEEMAYAEKRNTEVAIKARNTLSQIEPEDDLDLKENVHTGDAEPRSVTHKDVSESIYKLRSIAGKQESWANDNAVAAALKYIDKQKK